jgi:predicted dehydrogenase
MKKIRGVIVGTGRAGTHLHFGALTIQGVIIEAFVDNRFDAAQKAAQQFGVPHAFSSLEECLKKIKPDFVSICTNVESHVPLALIALAAGCHVLVEKPLTTHLAEAEQLIGAQKESGKTVCVVHNHKFYPGIQEALARVKNGEIGEVMHIHREMTFFHKEVRMMESGHWAHKLPGGRLFEANPHNLYLLYQLLGPFALKSFSARKVSERFPHAVIDEFLATFETGCATATIKMSINAVKEGDYKKIPPVFMLIVGTRGTLLVDYSTTKFLSTCMLGSEFYKSFPQSIVNSVKMRLQTFPQLKDKQGALINIGVGSGHYYFMERYVGFLRGTYATLPVSWEEAFFVESLNEEMGHRAQQLV